MRRHLLVGCVALVCLSLAACGGGGGDGWTPALTRANMVGVWSGQCTSNIHYSAQSGAFGITVRRDFTFSGGSGEVHTLGIQGQITEDGSVQGLVVTLQGPDRTYTYNGTGGTFTLTADRHLRGTLNAAGGTVTFDTRYLRAP